MSQFRRYFCLLYFLASFLDVLDALDDGPLQPLGLLGVEVEEVAEGGRVPEPHPQFGVPLHDGPARPDPADEAHLAVLGAAAGVRLDPVRVRLSGPLPVDPGGKKVTMWWFHATLR